jgi:hypothetical protein
MNGAPNAPWASFRIPHSAFRIEAPDSAFGFSGADLRMGMPPPEGAGPHQV